jgi:hypothetical protein
VIGDPFAQRLLVCQKQPAWLQPIDERFNGLITKEKIQAGSGQSEQYWQGERFPPPTLLYAAQSRFFA